MSSASSTESWWAKVFIDDPTKLGYLCPRLEDHTLCGVQSWLCKVPCGLADHMTHEFKEKLATFVENYKNGVGLSDEEKSKRAEKYTQYYFDKVKIRIAFREQNIGRD